MITVQAQRNAVDRLMTRLHETRYWGQVVLQYRDGQLVMSKLEQTIPTEALCEEMKVPIMQGTSHGVKT